MAKIPHTTLLLLILIPILLTPPVLAQSLKLQLIEEESITPNTSPTLLQKEVSKNSPKDRVTKEPKISISLNSDVIDFGILTPTNPIIRYSSININSNSPYYIHSYLDNYLSIKKGYSFIPNTSCDNGICNDTTPGPWISTLTYGLGIKCLSLTPSSNCLINTENDKYSTLPLNSHNFTFGKGLNTSSFRITYKLNSAPSQSPGNYENTLYYILIPSL